MEASNMEYNPNKYKNGILCKIPLGTWETMTPEQRAKYSDSPDTLKEIPSDALEIKMPEGNIELNEDLAKQVEALTKENEELKARNIELEAWVEKDEAEIKALTSKIEELESKESPNETGEKGTPEPAAEINPYELDVPALKEWLKKNDIKFGGRTVKLETLQDLIPDKYPKP